jgi:MFS family permease
MVATVTVPVLAPELALATKIKPHWIGVYSSLVFVGALVSILLGGSLARRFGAVTMSQIALGISGLALVATASGTVSAITISAVIAGFGYGLATPAASQILANVTRPGRHGIVFSLKQSTVSLGGLIAGVLVPALVVGFGWRAATLFVGFLVIAGSVLIHPLRTSHDDRQPRRSTTLVAPLRSIRYVLNHPRLRILALITFTFAAAQNSTNAIFVTYLVEKLEVPLVLAGLIFSSM